MNILPVILVTYLLMNGQCDESTLQTTSPVETQVSIKNTTKPSIQLSVIDKPHHLFIGRCLPSRDRLIHQENFVFKNDGQAHLFANIRINVLSPIRIACVKIFDEIGNGEGGYPHFVGGGLDKNYVIFNITTSYGKGFHFFVQVYENDSPNNSIK